MRIVHVCDSLAIGGAERAAIETAYRLSVRGMEVQICCSGAGPLLNEATSRGIPVTILDSNVVKRRISMSFARSLREFVDRTQPDIVHSHMFASSAAAAFAGLSQPLIATVHSEMAWRTIHDRPATKLVFDQHVSIIAVTDAIKGMLLGESRSLVHKIRVLPNPIPLTHLDSSSEGLHRDGKTTIGMVGRLRWEKGPDVLLDACSFLQHRFPELRIIIAGDGPERSRCEEMAKSLLGKCEVIFTGDLLDVGAIIRRLDALVVPSRSEGTPLVIYEAMALGVPIVASNVGGVPSQVRHGREALLVPVGDARSLARACEVILGNSAYAAGIAAQARKRIESMVSHSRAIGELSKIYKEMLRA
jgi:glycosyltransferase involved in cell wall biosynthesis